MKQLEDIKFAISYHALIILVAAYDWMGSIGKLTELTHQYLPFLSDISLAAIYEGRETWSQTFKQILVSDRTDRRTNGWTDRLTDRQTDGQTDGRTDGRTD